MIVNPWSFIFLNVNNSWGWSFLTWVFLCVFYLLIRSFVWQVLFLILTTFIFGPMGKWGTHFSWHFWGFANKYKKSVGKLTFCYIRIFKIIKKKKKNKKLRTFPEWAQIFDQLYLPLLSNLLQIFFNSYSANTCNSQHIIFTLSQKKNLYGNMCSWNDPPKKKYWKQKLSIKQRLC